MIDQVTILNAALEDDEETEDVIIRGVVEQTTLRYIGLDWYQRERGFSAKHIDQMVSALFAGSNLADITVGMRGQRLKSKGDDYTLLDRCYCINGGQRLYACAMAMKERPDIKIRLGAKIHLNTTEESENDLFCKLGTTQVNIGPSILLRNRRKKSPAAALLVRLNNIPEFALKSRVAWDQRKTRHELIFGYTLSRIIGALHAHLVGGLRNTKPYDLLLALDALTDKIGAETLQKNIIRFFDAIDKCWTIRQLSGERSEARPHLKPVFLLTVARLFSTHPEFWDGAKREEFYCGDKYVKKLRHFSLTKYVIPASVPTFALYEIMRKHLGLDPVADVADAAE